MAEKMSPCPFCNHSGPFDQWPCEWLDATEVNVIRCPMCHGAAPVSTWNRRHLAQPAQAVDVGAIREVAAGMDCIGSAGSDEYSTEYLLDCINDYSAALTRAIGDTQAEGWSVPEDPTGFSAEAVLDEANHWTVRHTGKQMLLNYAALLSTPPTKATQCP